MLSKDENQPLTDEQYLLDVDPRVEVIVSTPFIGESYPVAWTTSWDKGSHDAGLVPDTDGRLGRRITGNG